MPELPEVYTLVEQLKVFCVGYSIVNYSVSGFNLRPNKLIQPVINLTQHLPLKILAITQKGKYIFFELENNLFIINHLGMSGSFKFNTEGNNFKHTHITLTLQKNNRLKCLYYQDPRRFGQFIVSNKIGYNNLTASLGQQATHIDFFKLINPSLKNTSIYNLLSNQQKVSGLGNIYINEILFLCNLHPLTKTNTLTSTELTKLNLHTKSILHKAIQNGGSTIKTYTSLAGQGGFQDFLQIYGKSTCPECKNKITKIIVQQRSLYVCNLCQINLTQAIQT